MKRMLLAGLLLVGSLPCAVFCDDVKEEQDASDPTAPSPKIEETLVKIRRVEELDQLINDVAKLAAELDRVKQASAKDAAGLRKEIESITLANSALNKKLDTQTAEIHKQLKKQAADFKTQYGDLDANLKEQQDSIAQLQSAIVEQGKRQNDLLEALKSRFDDLETRLTNIPPVSLQGFVTGEGQSSAAILDLGGTPRVVREGDTLNLPPGDKSSVVRTLRVQKIADGSVLLEIGPWGQTMVVN